jgi:hypothetical protein
MYKEILLIRQMFTSRQFGKTIDSFTGSILTKKDKLVVAYNNLLLSLMPEILDRDFVDKKIYTCQMTACLLLLELRWGKINTESQLQYSIDPYAIMPLQVLS